MPHLGIGRAHAAATFAQAKPGTGDPKSWPMLRPSGEYTSRVAPGAVAMVARQIITAFEEGGCHCR
jgi:hypothetical protein